jgi:hypothetical protein
MLHRVWFPISQSNVAFLQPWNRFAEHCILRGMRHSLRASTEMEQHLLGPVSVQDRVRAERMAQEAKQARFRRQPLSGRDYADKPQERTSSIIDRQCPRGASARHGNHVVSAGLLSESRNKQGRGLYRAEIAGINARYARVSYVDQGEFDVRGTIPC